MKFCHFVKIFWAVLLLLSACRLSKGDQGGAGATTLDAVEQQVSDGTLGHVSCSVGREVKDNVDRYCWQSVKVAKSKIDLLSRQCANEQGTFKAGSLCEGIKDAAQCDGQIGDIPQSIFYVGPRWTNESARQPCRGSLIAGVYGAIFQASCSLTNNSPPFCIDYIDMIAEAKSLFQADCSAGVWQEGGACQVPSQTQGCQTADNSYKGQQVVWYPGLSDIKGLCSNGTILIAP